MAHKRKRRNIAEATSLAVGERVRQATRDYTLWSWVSDVSDASNITDEHLRRACGFSPPKICPNKYSPPAQASQLPSVQHAPESEVDGDCIIVVEPEAPTCDRKSCLSNSYCLNYLGQRMWEDYDDAKDAYLKLAALGPNPIFKIREPGVPVGLKNLGATCYANAFLQVWFQDTPFRSGVYRCQFPQDAQSRLEDSPIFQLQVTFAALQESSQNVFNPIKLVESLKLRTTEQQDAQEFSKLFMSHLDSEFQKQHNPALRSLVADQFQGKQVYGTICKGCKTRSELVSDFLEIEVNIDKNNGKLEELLHASLKPEILTGNNKYFCSRCERLQDATRNTAYTAFPPVLHFSLLRFIYDLKSMERRKSKLAISFPLQLDMNQFLRSEQRLSNEQIYDLRGILLHKGVSAYHGHYEAQVFDTSNGCWYQYNDEEVTKIKSLTTKSGIPQVINVDEDTDQETKKKPLLQASRRKKQRIESDDEDELKDELPRYVSSKDAYMLVYVRRNAQGSGLSVPEPPSRALNVVHSLNHDHDRKCEEYQKKEKEILEAFHTTRRQVMDIYQNWIPSPSDKSVVVSKKALETFLTKNQTWCMESGESRDCLPGSSSSSLKQPSLETQSNSISMTDASDAFLVQEIVCEHGYLDPSKAADMKCINNTAREKILSYGCEIVPLLTTEDVCRACVTMTFEDKLYQINHPLLVANFDEACEVEGRNGFWISKPWLKDWRLAKPKMHVQGQDDPPPDGLQFSAHVRCEHGNLSPNTAFRCRITEEASQIIQILFPSWNPPSTEEDVCVICESNIHFSRESKREFRKQAEDEKARLKNMYENGFTKNTAFLENIPCCIIPMKFMREWRQWLLKPAETARPVNLHTESLICEHNLLILDPNSASDLDSSVTLITRRDWNILAILYSTGPVISVERRTDENGRSFFFHEIDVCQQCRTRRQRDYDSTEITVRVLGSSDTIPSTDSLSHSRNQSEEDVTPFKYGLISGWGLRQSKRLKRGKVQKEKKITIQKTTTVKEIKVLIQEELSIPTIYQTLFYRGIEIDDNKRSVDDLGIMLNDFIDVRQEALDLNNLDDSGNEISAAKRRREGGAEGFGGTLLGGFNTTDSSADERDIPPPASSLPTAKMMSIACPTCTFINSPDNTQCSVCDYVFSIE